MAEMLKMSNRESYYFQPHFEPHYLGTNFEEHPIDELRSACFRLCKMGLIEHAPGAYIRLKPEGVEFLKSLQSKM